MNVFRLFGSALVISVLCASSLFAQVDGDFRSFQDGDWNDVNSWERYNGSSWINPAPGVPASTDGIITILNGHTIIVSATDSIDQLTIDAGGAIAISAGDTLNIEDGIGTDLTVNGILINSGAITLDVGADASVGDGGLYQHAQNGGTIPTAAWGTGSTCFVTGATANSPGNANQNFHHFTWNCTGQTSNLNLAWENITIGGNVTVESSGAGSNRFQFTNNNFSGTTITINGDLIVTGGAVTSNGSSGTATYTIEVMGDVNVTAGNLGLSRGSGGNATWRLHGDMSVANATVQTSNNQCRFVFVKTDTQTVTFENVSLTGSFHYEVDTSTTVIVADGPGAIDWNVADSLINRGTVAPAGVLDFEDGAIYVHARDGGSIPPATWETGSTCAITGVTGNSPANSSQDFHHFVWNCPGQSTNLDFGWANNTIGGNLSVLSSGSDRARMTSPGATPLGPNTITVVGNILVADANFESNGSSGADTIIVETHGNLTASNSVFGVSRGSGPTVMWNLYGDVLLTDAETRNSGGTKASFYFVKDGTQNLTFTNVTAGGGGFPAVVTNGSTLNLDSSVVDGTGAFVVDSGATLRTAHRSGFGGNLPSMFATKSFSADANYTYQGTVAQSGDSLLPATVNRLRISNPAGVTLNSSVTVSDTLIIFGGKLALGDHSVTASGVTGGSTTSYVVTNGTGTLTISSVGSATSSFPVGTTSAYAPVWIANSGTADAFSVSVEPNQGSATARVNVLWNISEAAASGSDATLTFGWAGAAETPGFASNRATHGLIFDMADTTEAGSGTYTRQSTTQPYTTSRAGFTTFGSFAVGDFIGTATSVEGEPAVPTVFNLSPNFPNPFNPSTIIRYDIPEESHVSIRIYDGLGRLVTDLVNADHIPGFHSAEWNASGFASGVYYCRIVAGDFVAMQKMILMR